MKETRGARYGRNLRELAYFVISSIHEEQRGDYKQRFLKELNQYSFEGRAKGSPRNGGCVSELEEIVNIDLKNPENLARLFKEGIHLMYQKQTAKRVFDGFLKDF